MRLLALDQASLVTGVAIFEDGKLIEHKKIQLNDTDDISMRLVQLRMEVIEVIQEYKIDQCAIEDIQLQSSVGNNVVTYRTLAEVRGVLEELFTEFKLPYSIISSNTWKSALKIRGAGRTEQKRAAQQYVLNKFGFKPIQDICDAICIGEYVNGVRAASPVRSEPEGFDWSE